MTERDLTQRRAHQVGQWLCFLFFPVTVYTDYYGRFIQSGKQRIILMTFARSMGRREETNMYREGNLA